MNSILPFKRKPVSSIIPIVLPIKQVPAMNW